jgi:hypothetical protein
VIVRVRVNALVARRDGSLVDWTGFYVLAWFYD